MSSFHAKLTNILAAIEQHKTASDKSSIYNAVQDRLAKAVTRYTKDLVLNASAVDTYDTFKVLKTIGQDKS